MVTTTLQRSNTLDCYGGWKNSTAGTTLKQLSVELFTNFTRLFRRLSLCSLNK